MENKNGLVSMVCQFFGLIDKCNTEEKLQSNQEEATDDILKGEMTSTDEERVHEQYDEEAEGELQGSSPDDSDIDENTLVGDNVTHDNYRKEVQANYNCVIDQMREIIQSQQMLNSSIDQLRSSTVELGNSVKLSAIYDGVKKLIKLWKLVNCSSEEISEYYSELLYDAFSSFGVVAIIPQPGELYCPEFHQKENSSAVSNTICSCEKYNWGWKIDDVILKKAIVTTQNSEDFGNEPNV